MKRLVTAAAIAVTAMSSIAGIASAHHRALEGSGVGKISPGVVTDIGGLGDRGFNDLAKAGLTQAEKKLGVSGKILVPQTPADYTNDLTRFAQSGAAPIFGIG